MPVFPGPVPPAVAALVTRAIAKERDRRHAHAADLLRDIEHCQANEPATAPTIILHEPSSDSQESAREEPALLKQAEGAAEPSPAHRVDTTGGRHGGTAPIYLTILRKGDTHIIDLAAVDPLIPRSETRVEQGFLDDICAEMERVAGLYASGRSRGGRGRQPLAGKAADGLLAELQGLGRLIFSHLLTQPARERLKHVAPCDLYLRLDDQLVQVPWELCFDGEDFLAAKFRVGRQVITRYADQRAAPSPFSPQEQLRVLLIADPTESLPGVTEEVEQLRALLQALPSVECTILGGQGVRKIPLLARVGGADVVHFAGHSIFNAQNPRESGWLLHEGVLTASEISKLDRPPLLVFSNSCQAGTTTEWQDQVRYEGEAFGLGSAFLLAGVRSFIGTFWPVYDADSLLFAIAFYRSLTAGQTLGGALLHARQETVRTRGWESLTWGSYVLYG
ncbi:MAG: CHAT domain-containing protein, partial [Candidatus Binatia bacterium]